MAKYTGPTLGDALRRWEEPHVRGIDTEMHTDTGLWGASMRIHTRSAEVELLVTGVRSVPDTAEPAEVHDAFDQIIHAPTDAALLASEVKRLNEQVRQLKELADQQG
jgi:hypothetical protein